MKERSTVCQRKKTSVPEGSPVVGLTEKAQLPDKGLGGEAPARAESQLWDQSWKEVSKAKSGNRLRNQIRRLSRSGAGSTKKRSRYESIKGDFFGRVSGHL